jgi:hypothetical protein
MEKTYEYTATYTFTHIKSGRKVIAQNWCEFHELQRNNDYDQNTRNGFCNYIPWLSSTNDIENRINKFWEGAAGYEKCGRIDCTGICGNPIRVVLKNMRNHAAMQGDKDLYNKLNELDKYYWYDSSGVSKHGNIHQLLLTQ